MTRAPRPRRLAGLIFILGAGLLLAAGCGVPPVTETPFTPSPSPSAAPTQVLPSLTPTLIQTQAATPSPLLPSPTPVLQFCSPLDGVTIEELADRVVNPYNPPPLGSDDPHQGVDLAELLPDTRLAVAGVGVRAALGGRVAGVVSDRFPYGNAILVETPLDAVPQTLLDELPLPADGETLPGRNSLTCPPPAPGATGDETARSLYLLYAHLQEAPSLQAGNPVRCGEPVGAIGSSGNALNPHLHLEVRLGPAGAVFPGLAHYETRARPEEMGNYCLWRVSGQFLPLDPLWLLGEGE